MTDNEIPTIRAEATFAEPIAEVWCVASVYDTIDGQVMLFPVLPNTEDQARLMLPTLHIPEGKTAYRGVLKVRFDRRQLRQVN